MLPDISVHIEQATVPDDACAIALLYPSKSSVEQADMVRRSLGPEYLEHTHGRRTILLAKLGDTVVGTIQVVWENEAEDPVLQAPRAAVIHHLRTHPDHQGRGIGKQLLDAAENFACARGMTRLTLGVEPDNEHARRLYQKWGFTELYRYRGEQGEVILGMHKRLGEP